MKRTGRILSIVAIMVIFTTCFAFADTNIKLEKSYPKDGGENAAIENFGAKLYFDGSFTQEKLKDVNANAIKLYGPEGEELPVIVLYPKKEKGIVLALLDSAKKGKDGKAPKIEGNSKYKIVISADFVDDTGKPLGKEETIQFTTLNRTVNTLVYMFMTVLMFGGIIFMSMRGNKKKTEEESKKENKVNPYKEAKRTGKSVEEILERERKEKAKREAREAKKAKKEEEEDFEDDYLEEGHFKVHGPRPISQGGGTYITGRKAKAEAEKEAKKQNGKKGKQGKK